jgi:hypothetical protein
VVSCNCIAGTGPVGVYVATPTVAVSGQDTLYGNVATGFNIPVYVDTSTHPNRYQQFDCELPHSVSGEGQTVFPPALCLQLLSPLTDTRPFVAGPSVA